MKRFAPLVVPLALIAACNGSPAATSSPAPLAARTETPTDAWAGLEYFWNATRKTLPGDLDCAKVPELCGVAREWDAAGPIALPAGATVLGGYSVKLRNGHVSLDKVEPVLTLLAVSQDGASLRVRLEQERPTNGAEIHETSEAMHTFMLYARAPGAGMQLVGELARRAEALRGQGELATTTTDHGLRFRFGTDGRPAELRRVGKLFALVQPGPGAAEVTLTVLTDAVTIDPAATAARPASP